MIQLQKSELSKAQSLFPLELFIQENGSTVFVMEKANKTGLMALNMLVTGSEIKPTDMELFTMQMETSMKGSGVKTKQTEKVSTIMQMEQIIMVSGKKTNNMDLVLNVGLMEPFTKDFI
jgi:hypothetical protein